MLGTAGNLSARLSDGSFWITASGCSKGELGPDQFVQLSSTGERLSSGALKPSAEASIHQVIYALYPDVRACYHVHSVAAALLSRASEGDQLELPTIEMVKGLGIWDNRPVRLDLFTNHAHVPDIATEMNQRFQAQPPIVPACLIRDHGVTVWGSSPEEARNRVEVAEFLFQYLLAARALQ
jgi:methylthioribulose-1-phosphate dehydratase